MSTTIRCPDCGHVNDAGRDHCEACNHPLHDGAPAAASPAPTAPERRGPTGTFAAPGSVLIPPRRPIRPRRPRPGGDAISLQLWLIFGTVAAVAVLWVAIQTATQRNTQPVEGSNTEQQQRAAVLFGALARDSNDVAAHHQLADLLYDTANWPDAIVHYRAAIRRDSSLINAIVDLGVCYYNLGASDEAERHFRLALAREPHQSVALFNLGVVYQGREQPEQALEYFHRALQSGPPESMRDTLQQRIAILMKQLGRKAPPLQGTP